MFVQHENKILTGKKYFFTGRLNYRQKYYLSVY